MISLLRRTLNRADLRCKLRDGDLVVGHFDNRKEATDWLWGQIADAEDLINEKMCEVDYLQENMQEMRDFLTDADTQPLSEQPKQVMGALVRNRRKKWGRMK